MCPFLAAFWDEMMIGKPHLSNEKNLRCIGYIGNYTTRLCGDYNKPL